MDNIVDLFLKNTDAIQHIVGSPQRRSIHYKKADSTNNDGTFYNTIASTLNTKASTADMNTALAFESDKSTTYTKTEIYTTSDKTTTNNNTEIDTTISTNTYTFSVNNNSNEQCIIFRS